MPDPSLPAETSITAACRRAIADEVALAGGNEVFFFGTLDDELRLAAVETIARGNSFAVPVILERAAGHHVLVHNHPGGDLTPSPADLAIASEAGARRLGFFIVDNFASRIYRVIEPFPAALETPLDLDEIAAIFSAGGLLARSIPAFEEREGQRDLAVATARALNEGRVAAFEAGTGVGKSYAYLVPSILWAVRNRGKVVVSTRTIHLGEQLLAKDLPTLSRVLPVEFRFALIKGRGNYACKRKTELVRGSPDLFAADDERRSWVDEILARLAVSEEGTRSDLPHEPPDDVWADFASTSEQSLKARCRHYRECFYYQARRRAFGAHVVVVNHNLFFADLAVRRASGNFDGDLVIPGYRRVVFDEAHHLEEVAAQHLGREVSRRGVVQTLGRLVAPPRRKGERERGRLPWLVEELRKMPHGAALDHLEREVIPLVRRSRALAEEIFETIEDRLAERFAAAAAPPEGDEASPGATAGGAEGARDAAEGAGTAMARLGEGEDRIPIDVVDGPLSQLRDLLADLGSEVRRAVRLLEKEPSEPVDAYEGALAELRAAERALDDPVGAVDFILSATGPILPWVELRAGRYPNVHFRAAPIVVSEILARELYPPLSSVVMTSATLTVGSRFDHLADRLGWDRVEGDRFASETFPSPFDYRSQALLVLPDDLPPPDARSFLPALSDLVVDAVCAARGRAFVLFTSHEAMRTVARRIEPRLRPFGFPLLVQGTEPRTALLDRFRRAGNAVLLGNQSFWEGVDVPGDALSLVILARLPFRLPNHPLELGRAEEVEARGKSAFAHLALPQAVLGLKQGFGRLIRTRRDRGAVVIADSRVLGRSYGKRFLASLPECGRAQGPWRAVRADLAAFFATGSVAGAAPAERGADPAPETDPAPEAAPWM